MWLECPRKWAWRHVKRLETPQASSAALGSETHTQLETYFGGGSIDFTKASGYIAASALEILPAQNTPGLELEEHFKFTGPSGLQYHGYIDLSGPDSSVFPELPEGGSPFVCDYKTTSNFSYAKSPDDLRTDPQGVVYGKALFEKYPEAKKGDLIWTYMATKGARKSKRVHLAVLRNDVMAQFDKIELTGADIARTYHAQIEPLALPPTKSACRGYGGCPHHPSKGGGCTDLASNSVINPEGKTMSLDTEKMLADLGARLGQAFPAPAPSTVQVAAAPLPELPDFFGLTAAQNDPGPQTSRQVAMPWDNLPALNPPGEAAPLESALLPPPAAVEEKPTKRGRKPKGLDAPPGPTKDVPVVLPPVPGTMLPLGWTLYVDCVPLTGVYMPAEHLIEKAHSRLRKEANVIDYRLVDFGKGAGALAASVLDQIDENWNQDITLDSRTPEGLLVTAPLTARAPRVVRGLR